MVVLVIPSAIEELPAFADVPELSANRMGWFGFFFQYYVVR